MPKMGRTGSLSTSDDSHLNTSVLVEMSVSTNAIALQAMQVHLRTCVPASANASCEAVTKRWIHTQRVHALRSLLGTWSAEGREGPLNRQNHRVLDMSRDPPGNRGSQECMPK